MWFLFSFSDTMLANPFGMNRMIDPRVAMQLMEEAKRNQMMMLSPYDMMDPVRLQVPFTTSTAIFCIHLVIISCVAF